MRKLRFVLPLVMIVLNAVGQGNKPKPTISKDPLTSEQIVIYRVVLAQYVENNTNAALNISNATIPADAKGIGDDYKKCFRRFKIELPPQPAVVHRLSPEVMLGPRMVLVDPDIQAKTVEQNDPDQVMHRVVDDHETVTERQIDDSVKLAFATGLFTFHEIAFDKHHKYAAVTYSFSCGMLCGHGNVLILSKAGGKWKVNKRCGGWIS